MADALAPQLKATSSGRRFVYDETLILTVPSALILSSLRWMDNSARNVVLQVKNGPIDFQPREPVSPDFGAMKQTPVIAEIQGDPGISGQAKTSRLPRHDVEEFLAIGHLCEGQGIHRRKSARGKSSAEPPHGNGFRDQSRVGRETGAGIISRSQIWYAFGRLAWNPELSAKEIADDWTRMTFSNDDKIVAGHSGHWRNGFFPAAKKKRVFRFFLKLNPKKTPPPIFWGGAGFFRGGGPFFCIHI